MKIGMEADPVEEMDRALERAIAAAAKAQFGRQGDVQAAFAEVHRLSRARLNWNARDALVHI